MAKKLVYKLKYLVWKYYLRQYTGWLGTHISAGPRITATMILAGLIQWKTGFEFTPWYEVVIWVLLAVQVWLSFPWGFVLLFPITALDEQEYIEKLNADK